MSSCFHVCLAKLQYGSALHYACGIGDEDFVRAVIAHGADLDSRVKALLQVVEYLQQKFRSFFLQDKESFTPLHIAAGYMHEKVIAILVQSGADPELQDKSGRSVRSGLLVQLEDAYIFVISIAA